MQDLKYRNEYKHIVTNYELIQLRSRLKHLLSMDKFAGSNGVYHIRSLYFDTFSDKALQEKIDGVNKREKFRIRLYNHNHDFMRLEKKSKLSGMTAKFQSVITKEEAENIINGDIDFMKNSSDPLIMDFYLKLLSEQLKPKTIVDYYREVFVHPAGNVRITFDTNIRTGIGSIDMFDEKLPTIPVFDNGECVLEVKYDNFLPGFIYDIIQIKTTQTTTYSKYAMCRKFI